MDAELFEVGVGKMGGEGFEEIIVGGTSTKEAKVKRAFFKHRRVDASMRKRVKIVDEQKRGSPHQDVSQVQVSVEGVPVRAPYLQIAHHFEIQPKTTNIGFLPPAAVLFTLEACSQARQWERTGGGSAQEETC